MPYAFTEQGVAMLSSVLRSERAVVVNVEIMRAFVRMRELMGSHKEMAKRLEALEACVAKLRPEDRVQLLAVDLEARPITQKFVPAGSTELRAAIEKLRGESPLGSTDMESGITSRSL